MLVHHVIELELIFFPLKTSATNHKFLKAFLSLSLFLKFFLIYVCTCMQIFFFFNNQNNGHLNLWSWLEVHPHLVII